MFPFDAPSMPDALRACAGAGRDTPVVFPEAGTTMTVPELRTASDAFAGALIDAGVRPGDVVGLLSSAGPQIPVGLIGTTAARAAASMLPNLSALRESERTARHVSGLIEASRMRVLLVDPAHRDVADRVRARHPELTVLDLPRGAEVPHGPARSLPRVEPDDVAVVQYTSGSTARPKGVVLRHRAVLAGLRSIVVSSRITADDALVNWVPHYHDMGLFAWLACMLAGAATHTLSPIGFIRRPARFLEYFADHGGTLTSGPNFGYDLLLQTVDADLLRRLDLRRWRLAYNGAEPVSAATVTSFAERFAVAGVGPGVMYPVYGMAEATLAVTFPEPGDHTAHLARGPQGPRRAGPGPGGAS